MALSEVCTTEGIDFLVGTAVKYDCESWGCYSRQFKSANCSGHWELCSSPTSCETKIGGTHAVLCTVGYWVCPVSWKRCNPANYICYYDLTCTPDMSLCEQKSCPTGYTKCPSSDGCLVSTSVCDGWTSGDCEDDADEDADFCENWSCLEGSHKCTDQVQCIYDHQTCDSVTDCRDGSDEQDCETCADRHWMCPDSSRCLRKDAVCDGHSWPRCRDRSDESLEICEKWNCTEGHSKCADNLQCVEDRKICDGMYDCKDRSDELNCAVLQSCPNDRWKCPDGTCVFREDVCDGNFHTALDCPDGSNEEKEFCNRWNCPESMWKCADNKQCIYRKAVCNSETHSDASGNCLDGSDEQNCEDWSCPAEFIKCANHQCVKVSHIPPELI